MSAQLTRLRAWLSRTFPRIQVVSLTEVTVAVTASSAWGFFIGWLTWGRS